VVRGLDFNDEEDIKTRERLTNKPKPALVLSSLLCLQQALGTVLWRNDWEKKQQQPQHMETYGSGSQSGRSESSETFFLPLPPSFFGSWHAGTATAHHHHKKPCGHSYREYGLTSSCPRPHACRRRHRSSLSKTSISILTVND
jgi:hypothetical protein